MLIGTEELGTPFPINAHSKVVKVVTPDVDSVIGSHCKMLISIQTSFYAVPLQEIYIGAYVFDQQINRPK